MLMGCIEKVCNEKVCVERECSTTSYTTGTAGMPL